MRDRRKGSRGRARGGPLDVQIPWSLPCPPTPAPRSGRHGEYGREGVDFACSEKVEALRARLVVLHAV